LSGLPAAARRGGGKKCIDFVF